MCTEHRSKVFEALNALTPNTSHIRNTFNELNKCNVDSVVPSANEWHWWHLTVDLLLFAGWKFWPRCHGISFAMWLFRHRIYAKSIRCLVVKMFESRNCRIIIYGRNDIQNNCIFVCAQCQFRPKLFLLFSFLKHWVHSTPNKWHYRHRTISEKKTYSCLFEMKNQAAFDSLWVFLIYVYFFSWPNKKWRFHLLVCCFSLRFLHWNLNEVNWTVKLNVSKSDKFKPFEWNVCVYQTMHNEFSKFHIAKRPLWLF